MKKPAFLSRLRQRAKQLRREVYTLRLAYRDSRTPWYAKGFAALVIVYTFSPIDLIPGFIPVLGSLDDLILVPMGIAIAVRMIPSNVMQDSRLQAETSMKENKPPSWIMAMTYIGIWLIIIFWLGMIIWKALYKKSTISIYN
jgi:uncharacterized membrane protein YkvA (DUF1232 family)